MGLRYFRDWRSNIQWKGSIFGLFFLKENIILLKELMIVNIWWYILICCSNFLKVWHLHFYSASNESVNHRSIFNSCRFLGGVSLPYIYIFSQYLIAKSLKLSQIGWRAFVSIHFQIWPFWPTHSNTWTCFGPNQWRQTPAFEGGWRTTSPHHDAATTLFYVNVTLPTCMSFWMGSKGRIQLTSFSVISKKGLNIDAYHNLF